MHLTESLNKKEVTTDNTDYSQPLDTLLSLFCSGSEDTESGAEVFFFQIPGCHVQSQLEHSLTGNEVKTQKPQREWHYGCPQHGMLYQKDSQDGLHLRSRGIALAMLQDGCTFS